MNGISISYPAGWTTMPATKPWTTEGPNFGDGVGDFIYEPNHEANLFFFLGSRPLGTTTGPEWVAERASHPDEGCSATTPVTVDGAAGVSCANGSLAWVATKDRGYVIQLYTSGDEGWLDSVYDRAWFEKILATVKLTE